MSKSKVKLSDADVELLNSKIGLKYLLSKKKTDVQWTLKMARYESRLREMQVELVELQKWVIENNQRVIIIFEGRDAAGKGGAIRRITAHINPRHYRIMALPKPTDEEKGSWYFERYINVLPKPGEIVFFDRSWYNRAVVEPVNGFCTEEQYTIFMKQVNAFEQMLIESGAHLIKLYFSITKEEQKVLVKQLKDPILKQFWRTFPYSERLRYELIRVDGEKVSQMARHSA